MDFSPLLKKLGIKIHNEDLFKEAFTHKSYINENRGTKRKSNERLEFLGDAVLELISTRFLFDKFTEDEEGKLTAYRSALVCGENLAKIAKKLDLGKYLYVSKGEEKSGGRNKDYIMANTFEAFIGAVYLDSGLVEAEKILQKHLLPEIETIIKKNLHKDAKSLFQEIAQERESITPHFEVLKESGPDHNKKFIVGAYLGEKLIAKGKGPSKQKASTDAASNALKKMKWN